MLHTDAVNVVVDIRGGLCNHHTPKWIYINKLPVHSDSQELPFFAFWNPPLVTIPKIWLTILYVTSRTQVSTPRFG